MRKIIPICIVLYILSVLFVFYMSVYVKLSHKFELEYCFLPYPHVRVKNFTFEYDINVIDEVELSDVTCKMTLYNLFFIPKFFVSMQNMDLYIKPNKFKDFIFDTSFDADVRIDDINIFYLEDWIATIGLNIDNAKDLYLLQINDFRKQGAQYEFLLDNRLLVNANIESEMFEFKLQGDNMKGDINIELEGRDLLLAQYNLMLGQGSDIFFDYFNINFENQGDLKLKGEMNSNKHIVDIDSEWAKGQIQFGDKKIKAKMDYMLLEKLLEILYLYNGDKAIICQCDDLHFNSINILDTKMNIETSKGKGYLIKELTGSLWYQGVYIDANGFLYINKGDKPCFKGNIAINDITNMLFSENVNMFSNVKLTKDKYIFDKIKLNKYEGFSKVVINTLAEKMYIYSKLNNVNLKILNEKILLNNMQNLGYDIDFELFYNNFQYMNYKFDKIKALGVFKDMQWRFNDLLLKNDVQYILLNMIIGDEMKINIVNADIKDGDSLYHLLKVDKLTMTGHMTKLFFNGYLYENITVDLLKDGDFLHFKQLDFIHPRGHVKLKGECDIMSNEYQFFYDIDMINLSKSFKLFHGFVNIKGGAVSSGDDLNSFINNLKSKGDISFMDLKMKISLHDFVKDLRSNTYTIEEFHNAIRDISSDGFNQIDNFTTGFSVKDGIFKIESLPLITKYINGNMSLNYDIDKNFFNCFGRCGFYMHEEREDSLYNFRLFINGQLDKLVYNIKFDYHVIRLLFQRHFAY
ncbi:MAG: hypothetical protein AAFO15_01355 [Pseudomonadota bacterium]